MPIISAPRSPLRSRRVRWRIRFHHFADRRVFIPGRETLVPSCR
jgi:hypothetical protein